MINSLHHFEILTCHSRRILDYFIKGYNFNLISVKQTDQYKQYLINSNSINFLITSLDNKKQTKLDKFSEYSYKSSLKTIEQSDKNLFNKILKKNDSVFNAAFQVCDLDRILANCQEHKVKVLKDKHILFDKECSRDGYVECAVIESCVDGVTHSLFDTSNYKGQFLPGFKLANLPTKPTKLTYFDHLTYATFKNTSNDLIDWYKKVFNMRRFKIDADESENGLIVKTGQSGMNLKVINYWLCAEKGVEFNSNGTTIDDSFKFVISEPLEEERSEPISIQQKKKNQISIFLEENKGPGIQHIGLFSDDIIESVQESKRNNSDIKYYATPEAYYNTPSKLMEIEKSGLDVKLLKENHILLDAEIEENTNNEQNSDFKLKNYLLQVFTQPIFDKNTVFLELIQRVGNATGFGAGNIKALWNAVECQINNKKT